MATQSGKNLDFLHLILDTTCIIGLKERILKNHKTKLTSLLFTGSCTESMYIQFLVDFKFYLGWKKVEGGRKADWRSVIQIGAVKTLIMSCCYIMHDRSIFQQVDTSFLGPYFSICRSHTRIDIRLQYI